MNSDLIKRIDDWLPYADEESGILASLLRDCRAEIERLSKPYVPMTDDERLDISRGMRIRTAEVGQIEAAIIKRAELNVANQCSYPDCLDNEDERCPEWLTGKCKRAKLWECKQ